MKAAILSMDNDGVRDDIENFIYEKRETLKYVRMIQGQMIEASDKVKSVEATRKLIDLEYCLEYTFAYTQMNFVGQVIEIDMDAENYYKYCEENV